MTHHVIFSFPFATPRDAEIIAQTLSPESTQHIPKSTTSLHITGTTLTLTITAEELSSLRAACNSYLRWIQTAISIKDLI